MTKIKKVLVSVVAGCALLNAVAINVSADSISPLYIDGDREVDYYSFSIEAGRNYEGDPDVPMALGIKKRHEGRNWVISVNSVSTTKYSVNYSVFRFEDPADPDNRLGYTEAIATDCTLRGTGNSGGRYITDVCAGTEIYMWANLSSTVPDGFVVNTSGQWSPDAPY